MNSRMTLGGVGPKLGLICLPYIILAIAVMVHDPAFLDLDFLNTSLAKMLGWVWLAIGFIFWIVSAWIFISRFKTGKLITQGTFAWCRNPIYASMILFIIPSLGVILHSGLILSIAVVIYIGFKISIHGEVIVLKRTFGEEYDQYMRSVNELLPFPPMIKKHPVSKSNPIPKTKS